MEIISFTEDNMANLVQLMWFT